MEVRSERDYHFDQPPEVVWAAMGRVDCFQSWWPWLRQFDAGGLVAGTRWECTIQPPMPYRLQFVIALDEVDDTAHVSATVSGDLVGTAAMTISPTPRGCTVRLTSALAPTGQPLSAVAAVAPWLARFGHDWILDTGLGQFRRRALESAGDDG